MCSITFLNTTNQLFKIYFARIINKTTIEFSVEEDGMGLIVEILGRGPGAEIFHETLIWSNINQIL